MSNLVIVAIPDENERVWKVSSEKVPHLTLLFLGDMAQVSNLEQIVLFVEHASSLMGRFHLSVDRRGELGDDKADVLFFKKNRYEYKAIRDFRASLLQDNNIKTAYDMAAQFNGPWNPHLTLGYPATPANPDKEDYGFYSVEFNRIAVWTDDFDGPEFQLKDWWDEYETMDTIPMDVAMSSLSHIETVSEKKWSEFKSSDYTDEQYATACLLDRGQDAGTAKQRYGLPVREPDGTLNRAGCHSATAVLSSTGGTGSARGNKLNATDEQINKAKNKLVALYKGPLDEDVPEGLGGGNSVKQTVDLGSEFILDHSGVKGMKWGVRKEEVSGGGHIRVGNRSGVATVSGQSVALVYVTGPLAFASPRFRSEFKAAGASNKQRKADRKAAKQDKKWEKKIYTTDSAVKVHNAMADHFNERISAINDKPEYKNNPAFNLNTHPDNDVAKKYYKEVNDLTIAGYREAVTSVHGSSPSGKKQAQLSEDGESIKIVDSGNVKHAAEDDETIEFLLRRDDSDRILEMNKAETQSGSMAQMTDHGSEFILEHFGTKGMKWGVRKEDVAAVGRAAKSAGGAIGKAASAAGRFAGDVGFENRVTDLNKRADLEIAIGNKAHEAFKRTDMPAIRDKEEYQKAKRLPNRLLNPRDPATKAYRKEVKTAYVNRLEEAANSMTNTSGTRQYTIRERGWELPASGGALPKSKTHYWEVSSREIQHATGDEFTMTVEVILDDDGFVTDLKDPVAKTMAQSADSVLDLGATFILEHYGVKGMHWGLRRSAPEAVTPTAMSRVPHGTRRKTKIKSEGGENHPAHQDAIKVAEARVKLKKSGTAALSNNELRDVANRMQLENQVKQLTSSKGRRFVRGELDAAGQGKVTPGRARGTRALKLVI